MRGRPLVRARWSCAHAGQDIPGRTHVFMEGRELVVIDRRGAMHQQLALRAQVQQFPDMARVVASHGTTHGLLIWRTKTGQVQAKCLRVEELT